MFLTIETGLVVLAFLLLVAGVVGSLVPQVPGALLSLAGVFTYWYGTGEPGTALLVALTLAGLVTWVIDFGGGVIAARAGGASNTTALLAGVVALVLFFLTGPLGVILGVAATVFAVEFYRQQDARQGLKAALVTTAGMLASSVAQALLTGSILLAMVGVALV